MRANLVNSRKLFSYLDLHRIDTMLVSILIDSCLHGQILSHTRSHHRNCINVFSPLLVIHKHLLIGFADFLDLTHRLLLQLLCLFLRILNLIVHLLDDFVD